LVEENIWPLKIKNVQKISGTQTLKNCFFILKKLKNVFLRVHVFINTKFRFRASYKTGARYILNENQWFSISIKCLNASQSSCSGSYTDYKSTIQYNTIFV